MKVRDIMTQNIAQVNPQTSITEVAQLMQKHNVGSLPVCDNNGIIGIVTDRDIVVRNIAHGKDPSNTTVQDVMTSTVKWVTPEMNVHDASTIMSNEQVRRLPVVENNKVIGMLALGDVASNTPFNYEVSQALSDISIPAKPENMPNPKNK